MRTFKILVGVKRVIDYAVKIRIKSGNNGIEYENVKHSLNPFDEIALEEGLRIREGLKEEIKGEVVVVSVGGKGTGETLRTALAMGADRAIHVDIENEIKDSYDIKNQLSPQAIARIFEKLFDKEQPQLVLMGKQAIDDDSNGTGQLLAGILDIPQATFASKVDVAKDGKSVKVIKEIDGGLEVLDCPLPTVITTDLRLNEPRYATLPNIMKSKSKPILVETLHSLQLSKTILEIVERMKVTEIKEPEKRNSGLIVKDVDELVEKIRECIK